MNDSQTVLGFTEAELGFILAVLFVALFVAASASAVPQKDGTIVVPSDSLTRLETRLAASEQRADSLKSELDRVARKRSNLTPPCSELRVAAGPIADVVIRGRDLFAIGDEVVTLSGLREMLAAPLAAAGSTCRHSVRMYYGRGVSVEEYTQGVRGLQRYFYGPQLGAAPNPLTP